jgi:transposase
LWSTDLPTSSSPTILLLFLQKIANRTASLCSDVERGSLLEVIDSHKSEEIIEALKPQPQTMRENVKEVSVDMWGGFPKVIQEVFPNALIVIDRFHVMKLVNQAVNQIRLELD